MTNIILCIDDEPIRYRELRKMAHDRDIVVVTTCRWSDFNEYIKGPDTILGVCLDHDMPTRGTAFAAELREYNYPVAITSLNPTGAETMKGMLDEFETPVMLLPCTTVDWETEAFYFWGLL